MASPQEKTSGVVLYKIPYNDKMSIVHIYTEQFGRMSYMLTQSAGKKARLQRTLFSPFSILEMEVEHKPGREIQRIKEARPEIILQNLHYDPVKSAVTLFLTEILARLVHIPEPNPPFYRFLTNAIQQLDLIEEGKANFHLWFLLKLSGYLGFYPNGEDYTKGARFDLMNGIFVQEQPAHAWFLKPEEAVHFHTLLKMNSRNLHLFSFNREERVKILEYYMLYFRLHQAGFTELKSLEILKAVFD